MSKQIQYILGILFTIIIGAILYDYLCCKDSTAKVVANKPTTEILSIEKNKFLISTENFTYENNSNFNFLTDNFNKIEPIDKEINIGIDSLKMYLEKNPSKKIQIIGYALSSEKNTSAFPNLGIARANNLKDYFISKGISSDKFDIDGEIKDTWYISNDTVFGPVNFNILTIENTTPTTDWDSFKAKYNASPIVLYFNTGESNLNLSVEERQKIVDLVTYLDNVKNSKLQVVGHSDNVGERFFNLYLGEQRAAFAKEYLVKNGVNSNRIETSSKGPDEPIADNKTAEGKSKNRRTVVTIK